MKSIETFRGKFKLYRSKHAKTENIIGLNVPTGRKAKPQIYRTVENCEQS